MTIRCVVYTHANGDAGRATKFSSIRTQRNAIRTFMARRRRQGWTWVATYEDVGQSGCDLGRPALQRLLADIDAGKIDFVVVYSFDRLTRSLSHAAKLRRKLRRRGITLVTVCPECFDVLESLTKAALARHVPRPRRRRWRRSVR